MSSSDSDSSETCSNPELKMEFDLKTACSLIPVMNNNENSIKGIIDSIEMYLDMLSSSGQKLLITFVLKSRLSQNAKLRMLPEYSSTKNLIKDLKNKLLVKKSPTAIQSRLQTVSQGYRTIEHFGTEIENLFADLTIAQADGDAEKYEILKPINERFAIQRFSDGLRNSRLSTIIAARNYKHLNEAIQAAKDEEPCQLGTGTALAQFTDYVNNRLNEGKFVAAIFIDYKKAFDTLEHDVLLQAMQECGIRGPVNRWFKCYLENRYLCTTIDGTTGDDVRVTLGVPTGSLNVLTRKVFGQDVCQGL
ncbi:uncharacterized protein LOC135194575 [Vanessa tameamea]|uniref:Uncharacterized protein LOC135194575 n=1 Tax=Vanessa tameamea TaxID=334116 RepID=A0ABM4AY87_VANTA